MCICISTRLNTNEFSEKNEYFAIEINGNGYLFTHLQNKKENAEKFLLDMREKVSKHIGKDICYVVGDLNGIQGMRGMQMCSSNNKNDGYLYIPHSIV
jgi:hypothetical protein